MTENIGYPEPVLDSHPEWVALYHAAWHIGANRIKHGTPQNGFASEFIGEGFSNHLFQWDTCLMAMFMRYGPGMPTLPALDNFYASQHRDGFICRELVEADGADYFDRESDQAINPPLFAWAELNYAQLTGDIRHAKKALPKLIKYFDWIKANRKLTGGAQGLLWQSNLGSGMDNSPREARGWVCLTAQQAHAAECIATIAAYAGKADIAARFRREYRALARTLNERSWNKKDGYYWDVYPSGRPSRRKTIAAFWPMLAGVPNAAQVKALVEHLRNPAEFWRPHLFPSLAADEQAYEAKGLYWLGGVWAPTNYAVVKGLQRYGYDALAREASENHLRNMTDVYASTGTIWENYAPELREQGNISRKDFVGWSGLGPIAMLIENVIGIRADALNNRIVWHVRHDDADRYGVKQLPFGNQCVDLLANGSELRISAQKPVQLVLAKDGSTVEYAVPPGETILGT